MSEQTQDQSGVVEGGNEASTANAGAAEQASSSSSAAAAAAATSSASKFQLNPSATEFVPKFTMGNPTPPPPQQQQQQHQQHYHNKPYHQKHHHHNNNYHHNNNRNNYHNYNQQHYYAPPQQHHHQQQHHQPYAGGNASYPKNNNNNNFINQNDIDPIEMEARCEAVVEILQDDRIREHLTNDPSSEQQSGGGPVQQLSNQMSNDLHVSNNHHQHHHHNSNNNNRGRRDRDREQQEDQDQSGEIDEEEMFEMMAMQEECRMEMMKFYIQSQNPELFSEIYHDVSYPDGPAPQQSAQPSTASNASPPAAAAAGDANSQKQ